MTAMALQTTLGPPLGPLIGSLHQPRTCAQGDLPWWRGVEAEQMITRIKPVQSVNPDAIRES